MLTTKEIKKELDAGREVELECIDRIGLLKDIDRREANEKILDQGALIVDYIDHDGDIMLVGEIGYLYNNVIVSEEFKYFRIKRPAPTFDDLMDCALSAHKKGLIGNLFFEGDYIEFDTQNESFCYEKGQEKKGIEHINSLYTETFVIESVDDTLKIDTSGGEIIKITLANGEVLLDDYLDCLYDISDGFRFKILKGATVTQKRGAKWEK